MLKPYMGYNRDIGASEGAVLVFAHNIKEAKKIGWYSMRDNIIYCGRYIDMAVNLMKGDHLYKDADQAKLNHDIPHVVDSPTICKRCNLWGDELDEKGLCEDCIKGKIYETN